MKKLLAVGLLGAIGVLFMAATCTVTNTRFTAIHGKNVFAGELKNDSGVNILGHKYRVAFIDSSNNLIEAKTVDGCMRSVKNGESDYFSAKSTSADSASDYALARMANLSEDTTFKVGDQAASDITISNLDIRRDGDNLRVTGTIKNNSSDKLYSPNACVVVFDDNGDVLIVQVDTSINDLAHNATDTFDVSIDLTDISGIASAVDTVDVGVDGLDGSASGTPVVPEWDRNNSVEVCGTPTNTPAATNTPVGTATDTPVPATATDTPTRARRRTRRANTKRPPRRLRPARPNGCQVTGTKERPAERRASPLVRHAERSEASSPTPFAMRSALKHPANTACHAERSEASCPAPTSTHPTPPPAPRSAPLPRTAAGP